MRQFAHWLSGLLVVAFFSPSAQAQSHSQIGLGFAHSCATDTNALLCWGWNHHGQLGNGTTNDASGPKRVLLNESVKMVDAGSSHTCAVTDRRVYCWGSNTFGWLGDGSKTTRYLPVEVTGIIGSQVTDISGGRYHTCAVVDGGVMCWGWNRSCQLGQENCDPQNKDEMSFTPVWVHGIGPKSGASHVAASDHHTCAVVNAGVKCWGNTIFGRLGDGVKRIGWQATPVDAIGLEPGSGVHGIAVGEYYSCALVNGGVKCWGESKFVGQKRKKGNHAYSPVDVKNLTSGSQLTHLAAENQTSCAAGNGRIYCWGLGGSGELGNGQKPTYSATPVEVKLPRFNNISSLSMGKSHVCAKVDGRLMCWGWNAFCQLGNGECKGYETAPIRVMNY